MSETPAATRLAEAYAWYSAALRDLVLELLDEADLGTASDTADDLCGDLWLHTSELAAAQDLSFTELLDALDHTAKILVDLIPSQPAVHLAGRLATASASKAADVAELAIGAVDAAGYQPVPRPQRCASTSIAFADVGTQRSAA
ncbi:hypothetical protein [Kitasatospora sp. NPDC059327]|uniref:hypothetical protein n=1 Tax=Kitasatospora sp. NPDC059327 TaxID=3346803 RepID=UPI003695E8CF